MLSFVGFSFLSAQNSTDLNKNSSNSSYQQSDMSKDNAPTFIIANKIMKVANLNSGAKIEIYSALGAKVKTITYNGDNISLTDLNRGIYIVKTGNYTQKIVL